MKKRAPEVTQQTIDAARKPLTAEERAVYDRMGRRWRREGYLGPKDILDSLVVKGWADCTRDAIQGFWVYQRRHSLD